MEPVTLVLFGATGDLAKRKIYPALYNLYLEHKLPNTFSLVGLGRREWSDVKFRQQVEQSLREFSRSGVKEGANLEAFLQAFRYSVLNIDRMEDYSKLLSLVEEREQALQLPPNRLFYLSVGPEYFETIAANIHQSGLGSAKGWKRLVIEKPFGHDLQSARELNQYLSHFFKEEEIYRIDHYLGKPMVQGLEALWQANPAIQGLLKKQYISNVQITASETVGVEERAGYYDHVGALRDMVQNHMLQLLMMTATQLSGKSTPDQVSLKKKLAMEALDPLRKQDVSQHVVRGQYAAGSQRGLPVPGYKAEPGIPAGSTNETFVAVRMLINDFFWRGVPFYIRTGKRMGEKATRIVIEFKEPLAQPAGEQNDKAKPNLLIIELGPKERITMQLNMMDLAHKGGLKPVEVELLAGQTGLPEAYENLIHDALNGDSTYFAHWDEVELSWKWVQPILEAFEENLIPLYAYPAGSSGPRQAHELLAQDGNRWWLDAEEPEFAEEEPVQAREYAQSVNQ
ncbi:glucose-6-phosphate dehydrogenase [Paenibacillus yonginensis]|uniref:Glucose-6-phosphate 1-dehydrogenase n=1 Tax=Paenibacillus yonginensis TaxID=1462996 RepID=A0A1B1MXG8_9BACL|nr:glucose-6-phosphate dehydrogenase [Paenibacillus yonginensis]ANS73882.1 glucose-6-phosphate dehydrogenase [Paenibacillus yonginensis]